MPDVSADFASPYMYGHVRNDTNLTYVTEGPLTDVVQDRQFLILLPAFVYTAVLMLIGLPGNFLVAVVYLLKMAKTTSRHFIISLAICDFINCAFGMPVELSLLANFYHFDYPVLCKISRFSTFFMNNTSSLVLIGIAIDRFRRVCLPLKPNMTVTQSKIMCIVFAIVSALSAAPALFIYGTRTVMKKWQENSTLVVLKTCHISDDMGTLFPLIFNLYLFFGTIAIMISLAIMYALVGRVVCSKRWDQNKDHHLVGSTLKSFSSKRFPQRMFKSVSDNSLQTGAKLVRRADGLPEITEPFAVRLRSQSDCSSRRHGGKEIRAGRTTLILFVVTLIFCVSFVPFLAIATVRYVEPGMLRNMSAVQESLYNFTLRSYLLNSAVNPLVYCFLNRQFRSKVKLLFRSLCSCK